MSNLISANVLRLRQYRIFWMTLGGVFLVSLFSMWGTSRSVAEMAQLGLEQTVDKYFFSMASYIWGWFLPPSSACFWARN